MASDEFKVVLTGEVLEGRELQEVQAAFGKLFGVNDEEVVRLFARAPVDIKSGLDERAARKYRKAIEQTGAACEVRLQSGAQDAGAMATAPEVAPRAAAVAAMASPQGPPAAGVDLPAQRTGPVEPRVVATGRGLGWIGDGFGMFRRAAGVWIVIGLLTCVIFLVLAFIPLLGALALMLLPPLFAGGAMVACREQGNGGTPEIAHLFAGFSSHTGALLGVGALYLAGSVLIGIVALMLFVLLGVDMARMTTGSSEAEAMAAVSGGLMLAISLLLAALGVLLAMAVWFAPALVMLGGQAPLAAMKLSLSGCLRNWLAFLVYGLLLMLLSVLAVLPLMLGMLVLVPVVYASIYAGYRDIYAPAP